MNHKRLQFLVPQYKEDEKTIKFLLDSIANQENIDRNDIGVIICSDGGFVKLDENFLSSYPYDIEYHILEHKGVSATRNSALKLSDADYIMFCDADDGFCNCFGISIIFQNLYNTTHKKRVDVFHTSIYQEQNNEGKWGLGIIKQNWTFVHGKIYNKEFLTEKNILFNEELKVNEDSYFNCFVQQYADYTLNIELPIYVWRYNEKSVSRQDGFLLWSLPSLIESNEGVLRVMKDAGKKDVDMAYTAFDLMCKVFLVLNNQAYYTKENIKTIDGIMYRMHDYYNKNEHLIKLLGDENKFQILMNNRNDKVYCNYIEMFSFNQFIDKINKMNANS